MLVEPRHFELGYFELRSPLFRTNTHFPWILPLFFTPIYYIYFELAYFELPAILVNLVPRAFPWERGCILVLF